MSKVLEEVSLWLLEEVLVWLATSATDDDIKQERQQIEAKHMHKSYKFPRDRRQRKQPT
jgi:hypothetical protein